MSEKVPEKVGLTMLIIVLAIPGLFIEPGPVSEAVALSLIASVWLGNGDGA